MGDNDNSNLDGLDKERVSVLVADIKEYSELSDDHLPNFFTEVLSDIANVLDKYNTISQNSWGDGIIAFFSEETNAVECAFDIRELFYNFSSNKYNLPDVNLDIRIALHTAWVWQGNNPIRSESGFVGSDIALAARIEPIAMPNHIFATKSFANLLPERVRENNNIAVDELYATELAKGWGAEELCHIRREVWEDMTEEELQRHHEKIKSSGEDTDTGSIQSVLIESDDPEDKKKAINILSKRGTVKAMKQVEKIAKKREDALADVRAQAVGRLDEFDDPRVIDTLIDVIENDDYYAAVNNAVASLGNFNDPRVYDTLVRVLEEDNKYADTTRQTAAGALGRVSESGAVNSLIEHLNPDVEDSIIVRRRAVDALNLIEDVRCVEAVIKHSLEDPDEETRGKAVEALADLGDKRAIEPLSEILRNVEENPTNIRVSAISSLVELSDHKAIDSLVHALDDPSHEVRTVAIVALGELKADSAIEEIESLLKDSDNVHEDIRAACAVSLKKMGQQESKDALIGALDDPSVTVQIAAIQGIGEAKIVDALPHLSDILNTPDENVAEVRREAALAIGDLEQADGLPALRESIDDAVDEVRRSIVQSAGFIDTPDSRQLLINTLESDRPLPVRAMAAKSLGASKDDTVVEPLLDNLSSDCEQRIARAAILALGNLSADSASIQIAEIACNSSDHPKLRRRALLALQVIPDPSITSDIYSIIKEEDTIWNIDKRAMNLLRAIGTPESTQNLKEIIQQSDSQQKVIYAQQLLQADPQEVRDDARSTIDEIYDSFRDLSDDEE